ncbi:MAG: hypothetical protein A3F54_00320 [Candidatus Kerfeldbacteria bacterium RIFCSPHIGHO2_12_FULL_48_17]|uniref:Vitamin K epoxide reductase domain-containing protein n=1 Tax=Candidatus Kerfeldbacteria bacterium RIFCSPHIGHO2_12_FULL_48_17 TaxID=1798542 RepID=A0A1G2B381_9BACT|nr:MAG: hypothetical protein A3F54_00320 [Candidatus Kerfeldbacteria bacterium RIFCSPHIGHO2_12_FULL_48_17]
METYLIVILVFAGIGIINTAYLVSHVISKKPVKCLFFPPEWCHKVQFSKYSRTLGIPNPVTGLGFYLAILILTGLFVQGTIAFWPIATIITIGFLFSVYFTIIQAFVLKAFCTWCVVSAIDFLVLFLVVVLR